MSGQAAQLSIAETSSVEPTSEATPSTSGATASSGRVSPPLAATFKNQKIARLVCYCSLGSVHVLL